MSNTVIVSVHGILTKKCDSDKWQESFDSWLESNKPSVVHLPYIYGWLGPINSWLAKTFDWFSDTLQLPRWTRRTRIDNFKRFLIGVFREYQITHNIHIMAHSFGTFITTEALKELAEEGDQFFVCSTSLIAGIVSSKLGKNGYDKLLDCGKIGTFHAWSSYSDSVVRYIARWPFGHLGYWGIVRPEALEDRSRPLRKPHKKYRAFNNHRDYDHSGYFKDEDVFYPEFLKSIKEAEKWETNRKERERKKNLSLYRKFVERGRSTQKRKSSQTRKKT